MALRLHRVGKRFEAGVPSCRAMVTVLQSIDLEIAFGEVVMVRGAPSSGKSTLLLCAAGLLEPSWGSVARGGAAVVMPCPTTLPTMIAESRLRQAIYLWDDPLRVAGGTTPAALCQWLRRIREAGSAVLIASRNGNPADLGAEARVVTLANGTLWARDACEATARRPARIAEPDTFRESG